MTVVSLNQRGKRSCGMTLGHGLSCQPEYQCGNCSHIEQLQKENAELKTLYKVVSAVLVLSDTSGTEPRLDPDLWYRAINAIESYEESERDI